MEISATGRIQIFAACGKASKLISINLKLSIDKIILKSAGSTELDVRCYGLTIREILTGESALNLSLKLLI